MCHVIVWDKNVFDNAYQSRVHHLVCSRPLETSIQETDLWYNIFSHPSSRHLYYVAHDSPYFPTVVYLPFLYLPLSLTPNLHGSF